MNASIQPKQTAKAPKPLRQQIQVRQVEQLCFSSAQTCSLLGVSRKTLSRLMERKLLRSLTVLRTHLFTRAEIERFLEESK